MPFVYVKIAPEKLFVSFETFDINLRDYALF